ncbi:MAG: peptidase [Gemmiger sp.]|nr:peptidase [Gemmiger sp.]
MTHNRRWACPKLVTLRVKDPALTLLVYAVLLLGDGLGLARMGLACALLHEGGHVAAYWLLLRCPPRLELSAFGICMRMGGVALPPGQELLLALAGPLANALLCLGALAGMQRVWGYSYGGYWFAAVNCLVGGCNLLPVPGLDGPRAIAALRALWQLQLSKK